MAAGREVEEDEQRPNARPSERPDASYAVSCLEYLATQH